MGQQVKAAMEVLSDVALIFLVVCLNGVMVDAIRVARRVRWSGLVGPFAGFFLVLSLFFDFFTVVYWDRRYDLVPGVDLFAVMGFQWYWIPRLALGIAAVRFWRSLRRRS